MTESEAVCVSLDIYVRRDFPGPDRVSRWLPDPEGDFYLKLRLYATRPEVLAVNWPRQ